MKRQGWPQPGGLTMEIGDTVKYIGTGFISFDSSVPEMKIISFDCRDIWVEYKGKKMLVRDCEVKPVK
jgi:hypothetical protein